MKIELDINDDSLDNMVTVVMKQMILDMSINGDLFDDGYSKYLRAFVDVHEFFTTQEDHNDFMKGINLTNK